MVEMVWVTDRLGGRQHLLRVVTVLRWRRAGRRSAGTALSRTAVSAEWVGNQANRVVLWGCQSWSTLVRNEGVEGRSTISCQEWRSSYRQGNEWRCVWYVDGLVIASFSMWQCGASRSHLEDWRVSGKLSRGFVVFGDEMLAHGYDWSSSWWRCLRCQVQLVTREALPI
jgi:hypothetical protein